MPKPPQSTPHSDLNGVNAHERRSTDVASEQGDGADTLETAWKGASARPPYSEEEETTDDRTG